ncbi:MAG TPA: DegT/DnrJ/EryC1/StrS family aminotransferase, partial [Armatimonadota bacterium]|nr:DegT/DnrJ/EryC1/StrS family aminotransferase [Armatimonadota bacterium]
MDRDRREQVLATQRPEQNWTGMLAAYYTQAEKDAILRSIEDSMDFGVGFGGGTCEEIQAFETGYAAYCGTAECVAVNAAGTGMDMAVMCLDLEPGDEVI